MSGASDDGAALAPFLQGQGGGEPSGDTRYEALVDPELLIAARMMRANMATYTPMTLDKLAQRRAWMEGAVPAPDDDVPCQSHSLARSHGEGPAVEVRVVGARAGAMGAGILHIHGGGFTASSARAALRGCQALTRELGVPVVTVDYRLAPETRWEGALADNLTAFDWMATQAAAIGIDPQRIVLAGESAGAGHAAMLALALRDRASLGGGIAPRFMALAYPMLDDRTGTSRATPEHVGWFGWNAEANRFGWESYLGMTPGGAEVPVAAVPGRREDLAGLPPTWIGVGGLDLFVGESMAFAQSLSAAGVPVELLVVPGAFHGFDSFVPGAALSRRFMAAKLDALRRAMASVGG